MKWLNDFKTPCDLNRNSLNEMAKREKEIIENTVIEYLSYDPVTGHGIFISVRKGIIKEGNSL